MKQVIVIGGGAAGMMAAYEAAMCGGKVTLFEKNEKLGKSFLSRAKADVTSAMRRRTWKYYSKTSARIASSYTVLFILGIIVP